MLNMSFYGSRNKDYQPFDIVKITELIQSTNKPIVWREGFAYRGATARPISREKALEVIKDSFLDVHERENEVELNTFSENDML